MTDEELVEAARQAAAHAYAPYSRFAVGAALLLDDGSVVTGANVENASYGLSLCAETVAAAKVLSHGWRGGLEKIAVAGPGAGPVAPCGRCRQVLSEIAGRGGTDPEVICAGSEGILRARLSELLPHAFGPDSLD